MVDLRTSYLGLELANPLVPSASPLTGAIDTLHALEEAGAAAVVMPSLFEEQIVHDALAVADVADFGADFSPEFFGGQLPAMDEYNTGSDTYLDTLVRAKNELGIPVIGSLNGVSPGGWVAYGHKMQDAGADALELNIYDLPTNLDVESAEIESQTIAMVRSLNHEIDIPLAVKLSPIYTSLPNVARQLQESGADGFVLFNRFYQPDFDIEALETRRTLKLSSSDELLPRLHWLAILSGRLHGSLAASGGVHTTEDVIKAVMSGAHAVQMVSALLQQGPDLLRRLREELTEWLEEHEYHCLEDMQGSMNLLRCTDPRAYERVNYMELLQSWGR